MRNFLIINVILLGLFLSFNNCSFDYSKEKLDETDDNSLDGNGLGDNNDNTPKDGFAYFTIDNANVKESDSFISFRVSLDKTADKTQTLKYRTNSLVAKASEDFQEVVASTLTFYPGEKTKYINLSINEDTVFEGNEVFNVEIYDAGDLSNTSVFAEGTIEDNELCPENYIYIQADGDQTVQNFCVMKYEAKLRHDDSTDTDKIVLDGNENEYHNFENDYKDPVKRMKYFAASVGKGQPWTNIRRGRNKDFPAIDAGATDACQLLNDHYNFKDSRFDLINNGQWQTIAHQIEANNKNWSGGQRNNGELNRGHSDSSPAKSLSAVNDNNPCFGTEQLCNTANWNTEKRTHYLNNDQIIWDFAGNVWENIKDDRNADFGGNTFVSGLNDFVNPAVVSLSYGLKPRTARGHFAHSGNFTSSNHLGFGYAWLNEGAGTAVLRGGGFTTGDGSGAFAVYLGGSASGSGYYKEGFRCVYVPK